MRLEQFDPAADEARLEACRQIREAGQAHDDPLARPLTRGRFLHSLTEGPDADRREAWLATGDSEPLGFYSLQLPGEQNLSLANLVLRVPPALRRRGTGRVLLAHAAGRAQAAGRTVLRAETMIGTAGDAFAAAAGATPGQEEVRRSMLVDGQTTALLARLHALAGPAAAGYSVVAWDGATPPSRLEQLAGLYTAMADAPHDATVEPDHWDGARVRQAEEEWLAAGAQLSQVAARHDQTGRLAGMSGVFFFPEQPELVYQGDTVVVSGHRGHRLGMLLKTALYQRVLASQPEAREFRTWNADTNQYMGAINEQLGFRVTGRYHRWELPVASARPG